MLYNLTPSRELTQPWCESSSWGDSDQCAAYIPSRDSASAALPYVFAGTHFTYPQRDGRLNQPPARLSGYWTWDLSHESLLLYQLSYPGQLYPHCIKGGYWDTSQENRGYRKWPTYTTVTDVRSLLEFTNNYRRFIHWYAHIAIPLNLLTLGENAKKKNRIHSGLMIVNNGFRN